MDLYERSVVMKGREGLERMTDEELDKLLPIGLDIIDQMPDYTKTVEENQKSIRERKIEAILNM